MPRVIDYAGIPTEQPNPKSRDLDRLSIRQILRLMNREDTRVPRTIAKVIPSISSAVSFIARALRSKGRLFFLGAGTSGRLGLIEAAECPPTFNIPHTMIQAIIAGGRRAVFRSLEGTEDDRQDARKQVKRIVRRSDVVVGIAASGLTPFVEAGLKAAKAKGAKIILLTCNPQGPLQDEVDVLIAPRIGPELIAGSTRLKAGTATKLILNMLTVATMVRLGKVYGSWMVDVRPTSRKLSDRALRIIQQTTGVSREIAARTLRLALRRTKTAIVMAACRVDYRNAQALLEKHRGKLRRILPK